MILAARKAGDLAGDGQPTGRMREAIPTLESLGVEHNLAAYSVRLAALPDEVWQQ
jgi:hypothetical protein